MKISLPNWSLKKQSRNHEHFRMAVILTGELKKSRLLWIIIDLRKHFTSPLIYYKTLIHVSLNSPVKIRRNVEIIKKKNNLTIN